MNKVNKIFKGLNLKACDFVETQNIFNPKKYN
jgi:hypothetical protein